jgi:hypothetical protein
MPEGFGKVVEWAKEHPIPAAGIAGLGLAAVAAVALGGKKKSQQEYVIPNVLTPGALVGSPGGSGYNPGAGGVGPGGGMPVPPTPSPDSPSHAPTPSSGFGDLFAVPQDDVFGVRLLDYHIVNPYGSAAALAAEPQNYYVPSLSDFATEVGGGITRTVAASTQTDAAAGRTYTIDNTTLGTGPVVPVSQRIVGEHYDAEGRVIV